jgi:hypothetical protein
MSGRTVLSDVFECLDRIARVLLELLQEFGNELRLKEDTAGATG